jgi:thiol:disulfide interchange protein
MFLFYNRVMRPTLLYVCLLLLGLVAPPAALAQTNPVTWAARVEPADARAGEAARIVVEAKIEEPWHLYSLKKPEGFGPRPTSISLAARDGLIQAGQPVEPEPHREFDKGFKTEVAFFSRAVAFGLPIQVGVGAAGEQKVAVNVGWMVCKEGTCLPPEKLELPVTFAVAPGAARPERLQALTTAPAQPAGYQPPLARGVPAPSLAAGPAGGPAAGDVGGRIRDAQSRGLLPFIGLAILMGFLALLTPCVFPMVPITVSFFAKQQEVNPRAGVSGAVAYCLGIIGTFTGLGLLVTLLFGAGGISALATNPYLNLALAVLFVVLAVNLFGGFEIILPGWLVEKTQTGSQRSGLAGPMLMGLTFTLTSFTCTVAFVGTLLATTTQGNLMWPLVGMLAFSTAFASPFFLLALFPQWLARVPKSGGWLVTVKAFMGFLELAAALKFLSNTDLVWGLGLLTRPVFLAIWSTIALVAAFYMVGWLRLPHDAGGRVGSLRFAIGVATAAAGVACLSAINGASLGQMNAFLPPAEYPGRESGRVAAGSVRWIDSYDEAVKLARAEAKPLFLDFTGVTCTNCRDMEENVFKRPEIDAALRKFVTVRLYTDKETPESERYKKMEQERFGTVALPLYVVLAPDEKKLAETSYNPDAGQFLTFLQDAYAMAGGGAALTRVP